MSGRHRRESADERFARREREDRLRRAREDIWLREERRRRALAYYEGTRNAGRLGCFLFVVGLVALVILVVKTS